MKPYQRFMKVWKLVQIYLLYLISILLIFWMYPREGKFQYEYVKNRPWKHENLIAPFDFPIYKNDAQLAKEVDSITRNNTPYFTVDTIVYGKVISEVMNEFHSKDSGLLNFSALKPFQRHIYDTLPGLIRAVYDAGIIEMHPTIQETNPGETSLIVRRRHLADETKLSALFTQKQAYEYVMSGLREYTSRSAEQILSRITIAKYIRPNIFYDEAMTQNVLETELDAISTTQGMVQAGQIIIARGELVSPSKFQLVESLRKEYESNANVIRNYSVIYLGQFILISVLLLSLLWYVINFRRDMMGSPAQTLFILSLIVIMVGLTKVTVNNEAISYYVIPFAIIPIFLKTFFNVRFALFVHFLILLLAGFWIPNSYQFLLMNFLAGVVAVFSMRSYYKRGILFFIAMFVSLTYILIYVILSLLQEGTLDGVNWMVLLWFGGNGLLILTVYPLIYIFERLFGFLSDATLFELSDTNQPLLRMLAEKAPGTFQHSLQVASLAEEAVLKVGGNPLIVRTGALYHDIGKMNNPYFFIENQMDGENPHDKVDFKTSAKIIIDHVFDGVELAKKYNLPAQIIDFILTHHGTSTVQYFYRSYLSNNPDEEVDINAFRYPGPKPHMKEMAVVMIADSVEAASRSMKDINEASLNQLVDNIVEHQTREDQYSEADITFSDISAIKKIFKRKLINIYHARIAYPE
ncbi:MAG: HDIG domain-containing protein [Bacteroidales bacterium]|nr:HDIG domain-containing protein [Bacteroidales bacterium]